MKMAMETRIIIEPPIILRISGISFQIIKPNRAAKIILA